jgi:hypothetical protein
VSFATPGLVPASIETPELQQFDPPDEVTRHSLSCPPAPRKATAALPSPSGATLGLEPLASTHPWFAQLAGPVEVS